MFQRLHETGVVKLVLGDHVGAIEFPKLLVQWMIHFVEFVGAWDASFLKMVFGINLFEGHFGSGIKIPEGTVQVEENMTIAVIARRQVDCFASLAMT